jgi:hypothetical protein
MSEGPADPFAEPSPEGRPRLLNVDSPTGIVLAEHLFLPSLPPCCAQSALPYWAKVTGTLENGTPEDITASIMVTLLDAGGVPLAVYGDTIFLDAGETSPFEVKLIEFRDKTTGYSISIEPVHEM